MKSRPLKVAYDCQIFAWQSYGGISRYFVEVAKRIALCADFSVKVVAPMHVSRYLLDSGLPMAGCYAQNGALVTSSMISIVNRVISPPCLWAFSPHIVHETFYGNWSYAPRKSAVIVTAYDMIHEKFPQFYPNDTTSARKRKAVTRADMIICISESTRSDLIEILGVPKDRTRVIYLGADLVRESLQHTGISPMNKPFLLYVGERGLYKNFSTLLDAYASSPQLKREFVIVAFGRQPFWSREITHIRDLGLSDESVVFRSGDDNILSNYYRHAAALVYPSLYEGFGLPPLEAMYFGCPVACSNTSALPETVGDAAVLFDPRDPEAVRDAIERLVFSTTMRQELATRARLQVRKFTWERCAAETMATYRELRRP